MKKIIVFVMSLVMVISISSVAFAANETPGTTKLSTSVPNATYTLNIPSDQTIEFGKTITTLGNVTVTDSAGFAKGKNLKVTLNYGPFTSTNVATTIPILVQAHFQNNYSKNDYYNIPSGSALIYEGNSDGEVEQANARIFDATKWEYELKTISCNVTSDDWGKALGGAYTSTITFLAEVVVQD